MALNLLLQYVLGREFKEYILSDVSHLRNFGFEKGGFLNIEFDPLPLPLSATVMLARTDMLGAVNTTVDPCNFDQSLFSNQIYITKTPNQTLAWKIYINEKGVYTPILLTCSNKRQFYQVHYIYQNPSSFLDFREYEMPKHFTVLSILLGLFSLGMFFSLYFSRHTFYLVYYLLAASTALYALWQSYLAFVFIEIDKYGKLVFKTEIIEIVLFILSNSSFLALLVLGGSGFSTLSSSLRPEYIFKVFANSIIFATLMRIREFTKSSVYADFTAIIIMFFSVFVFFKWFSSSLNHVIFDTAEMYSIMWKKTNLAHIQNACMLLAVFHCLSYVFDAFTGSLASYVFPPIYYFIMSVVLYPKPPTIFKPRANPIVVDGPTESSMFIIPL